MDERAVCFADIPLGTGFKQVTDIGIRKGVKVKATYPIGNALVSTNRGYKPCWVDPESIVFIEEFQPDDDDDDDDIEPDDDPEKWQDYLYTDSGIG